VTSRQLIDEAQDKFALFERCLEEGICPSGCGPLAPETADRRTCAICGFSSARVGAVANRRPHLRSSLE
jgi:hypothetical protein